MKTVYLDNSATTKIREEALKKYIEVSDTTFGNPSSLHSMGYLAERELNCARAQVLSSLGLTRGDVIFTASGSEANNLATVGRAYAKERFKKRRSRIITTEGEHASVNAPLEGLSRDGFDIVKIPTVGGVIDKETLLTYLDESVILVTLMLVNNETGALYDIASLTGAVRQRSPEALIHIDATQAYMKLPISKRSLDFDMITLSSHKIEGPKGVGALVLCDGILKSGGIRAITLGGGQEKGLRSGTENVPAIAAFGEAVRCGVGELKETGATLGALRDRLVTALTDDERFSSVSVTDPARHAPHILNITLPKIKSETMLHFLSSRGVYVSSGSACSSNSSHKESALVSFGRSAAEADCSIRISLGKRNTDEDIDIFLEALHEGLTSLSRMKK